MKNNLNNFWGRFGMIINRSKTELYTELEKAMMAIMDANVTLQEMLDVSNSMMLITTRPVGDTILIRADLSLVIARLMTANAHTHLYKAMETLEDDQVLYFDTGKMALLVLMHAQCSFTLFRLNHLVLAAGSTTSGNWSLRWPIQGRTFD